MSYVLKDKKKDPIIQLELVECGNKIQLRCENYILLDFMEDGSIENCGGVDPDLGLPLDGNGRLVFTDVG